MSVKFDGEFTVATPRSDAYAVLSDAQQFAPLLPSYKTHTKNEDGTADVEVKVGVGKIRGTAKINLMLEESEAPVRAKYSGKGAVMGGAFNLVAEFELMDAGPKETRVQWQGELIMFGKLVSLAGGMIKPIAKKDIGRMIDAIRLALGGDTQTRPEAAPLTAAAKSGPGWWNWLGVLAKNFVLFIGRLWRTQK